MKILLILTFLFMTQICFSSNEIQLNLAELTQAAVINSDKIKSLSKQSDGLDFKKNVIRSYSLPKLNVESSYKYTSDIPTMSIPLGLTNREIQTGKHNAYFIGLSANYLLTDFGSNSLDQDSVAKIKTAKNWEIKLMEQSITLEVKNTFFKIILDIEKMRLVLDSWRLSLAQHLEISKQFKAGSANQIDLLQSRKEALDYRSRFIDAQNDLSLNLHHLFKLSGNNDLASTVRLPIEKQMLKLLPDDFDQPQTILSIDLSSYKKIDLDKILETTWNIETPGLKRLSTLREGHILSKQSITRTYLPKVSLFLKSGYEYPDGSKSDFHRQNTIGVNLTMPIWDGGFIMNNRAEKQTSIDEISFEEMNLKKDLSTDLDNTLNNLHNLKREQTVIDNGVLDVEQMSKLIYKSYLAGKSTITDVLVINLKALDWKVRLAQIQTQIYMQIAILEYLCSRSIL